MWERSHGGMVADKQQLYRQIPSSWNASMVCFYDCTHDFAAQIVQYNQETVKKSTEKEPVLLDEESILTALEQEKEMLKGACARWSGTGVVIHTNGRAPIPERFWSHERDAFRATTDVMKQESETGSRCNGSICALVGAATVSSPTMAAIFNNTATSQGGDVLVPLSLWKSVRFVFRILLRQVVRSLWSWYNQSNAGGWLCRVWWTYQISSCAMFQLFHYRIHRAA